MREDISIDNLIDYLHRLDKSPGFDNDTLLIVTAGVRGTVFPCCRELHERKDIPKLWSITHANRNRACKEYLQERHIAAVRLSGKGNRPFADESTVVSTIKAEPKLAWALKQIVGSKSVPFTPVKVLGESKTQTVTPRITISPPGAANKAIRSSFGSAGQAKPSVPRVTKRQSLPMLSELNKPVTAGSKIPISSYRSPPSRNLQVVEEDTPISIVRPRPSFSRAPPASKKRDSMVFQSTPPAVRIDPIDATLEQLCRNDSPSSLASNLTETNAKLQQEIEELLKAKDQLAQDLEEREKALNTWRETAEHHRRVSDRLSLHLIRVAESPKSPPSSSIIEHDVSESTIEEEETSIITVKSISPHKVVAFAPLFSPMANLPSPPPVTSLPERTRLPVSPPPRAPRSSVQTLFDASEASASLFDESMSDISDDDTPTEHPVSAGKAQERPTRSILEMEKIRVSPIKRAVSADFTSILKKPTSDTVSRRTSAPVVSLQPLSPPKIENYIEYDPSKLTEMSNDDANTLVVIVEPPTPGPGKSLRPKKQLSFAESPTHSVPPPKFKDLVEDIEKVKASYEEKLRVVHEENDNLKKQLANLLFEKAFWTRNSELPEQPYQPLFSDLAPFSPRNDALLTPPRPVEPARPMFKPPTASTTAFHTLQASTSVTPPNRREHKVMSPANQAMRSGLSPQAHAVLGKSHRSFIRRVVGSKSGFWKSKAKKSIV